MRRTAALLLASIVGMSLLVGSTPASAAEAQADAWIKLCGLSTGCTINPPPHPWKGRDVYNGTAAKQTVKVRLEDGEGARFWIVVQNDGDQPDTLTVKGCAGTRDFTLNAVLMGKHKRPSWKARNVTRPSSRARCRSIFPPPPKGSGRSSPSTSSRAPTARASPTRARSACARPHDGEPVTPSRRS
jgi:hypothetical protein